MTAGVSLVFPSTQKKVCIIVTEASLNGLDPNTMRVELCADGINGCGRTGMTHVCHLTGAAVFREVALLLGPR